MSLTSTLTSLGIGAPPASFADASAAAADQKTAIGGLTTSISGISSSLSVLTAAGAPASVTGPIKNSLATGNTLLKNASTMTPAQIKKETANLETKHHVDMANQATTQRTKDLKDLRDFTNTAGKTIKKILANKKTSKEIRDAASKFMTDLASAKKAIESTEFTHGTGSSSNIKIYTRPENVPTIEEFSEALEGIQDAHDTDTGNDPAIMNRQFWSVWNKYVWPTIFTISFAICFIFGGISTSNAFLPKELYSVYNRFFYFLYGGLFFPITLPWFALYSPEWYASICPLFSHNGSGPIVNDPPPPKLSGLQGASALLGSATSQLGKGLSNPLSLLSGGADTTIAAEAATAPKLGYFSYVYPLVPNPEAKTVLNRYNLILASISTIYIMYNFTMTVSKKA